MVLGSVLYMADLGCEVTTGIGFAGRGTTEDDPQVMLISDFGTDQLIVLESTNIYNRYITKVGFFFFFFSLIPER